jgi:hypothetical protein
MKYAANDCRKLYKCSRFPENMYRFHKISGVGNILRFA